MADQVTVFFPQLEDLPPDYGDEDDPMMAHQRALLGALEGDLNTPEAVTIRRRFQAGEALWVAPPDTPEVFATLVPTLRRTGDDHYSMGGGDIQEFATDADALLGTWAWYVEQRRSEIEEWLRGGEEIAPSPEVDALVGALLLEGEVQIGDASVVALEAGLFFFESDECSYVIRGTPADLVRAGLKHRQRLQEQE